MQWSGRVVKQPFAQGSKSEREAVLLDTGHSRYVLCRRGGNPFHDPALERLVGKFVRCSGDLSGYTLIIDSWSEVADVDQEDRSK